MTATVLDCPTHRRAGLRLRQRMVQETEVLTPWNIHQKLKAKLVRQVEQPTGRNMVDPDQISVQPADLFKIPTSLRGSGKGLAGFVRCEGTIGNSPGMELLGVQTKRLSVHPDSMGHGLVASHVCQTALKEEFIN